MSRVFPVRDRVVLGLLAFFLVTAWTVELYWVLNASRLVERSRTDVLARVFRVYGAVDDGYFDRVTPYTRGLETLQVFVTQPLCLLLGYAILRRKAFRYPLQLVTSSYVSYSVVLYFWTAHLSGYEAMRVASVGAFLLFYGANLPWLFGNLFLAADAFLAIRARFLLQDRDAPRATRDAANVPHARAPQLTPDLR